MRYEVENINELDERTLKRKEGRIATKCFSRIYTGLIIYTLIAGLAVFGTMAFLYFKFGPDTASEFLNNPYIYIGLNIFSMYVVAFPIFMLFIRPVPARVPFRDVNIGAKEFFRLLLVCIAVMQLGNVLANSLKTLIYNATGYVAEASTASTDTSMPLIPYILFAVIIGPIFEELIFRKAIIDRLGRYGEGMAIAVSSIAFGLFHGNFNQFIYTIFFGFILGNAYVKCGKIRYPILLHMLANLFGTLKALVDKNLQAYFPTDAITALQEPTTAMIIWIAAEVLLCACIVLGAIVLIRGKKTGLFDYYYDREIELTPFRRLRCVLLNSGAIWFLIIFVLAIISALFSST